MSARVGLSAAGRAVSVARRRSIGPAARCAKMRLRGGWAAWLGFCWRRLGRWRRRFQCVPPEDRAQPRPAVLAAQRQLALAVAVKNHQRDMGDAMLRRERPPARLTDIGDDIFDLAIAKLAHRRPRLPLQSQALAALRIMDLHHCRDAIADAREVLLRHRILHFGDRNIPAAAQAPPPRGRSFAASASRFRDGSDPSCSTASAAFAARRCFPVGFTRTRCFFIAMAPLKLISGA